MEDQTIFLAAQNQVSLDKPESKDIYRVGTVAYVKQMLKLPNGTIRDVVEGLRRGEITRFIDENEEYTVESHELEAEHGEENEGEDLMHSLLRQFEQYIKVSQKITKESLATVSDIDEPSRLADIVTSHLSLKIKDKQDLLEMVNVKERLQHLIQLITDEKKVL